jgi:hypothetical protein
MNPPPFPTIEVDSSQQPAEDGETTLRQSILAQSRDRADENLLIEVASRIAGAALAGNGFANQQAICDRSIDLAKAIINAVRSGSGSTLPVTREQK